MEPDALARLRALSAPDALPDPDLLSRVLEALPDAVVVIDTAGAMLIVNAQSELTFGYPKRSLLGQSIDMLLPDALRARHAQHRRGFFLDPRSRPMGAGIALVGLHMSGEEIPLEINLSPIMTDHGLYAVAVIRKRR